MFKESVGVEFGSSGTQQSHGYGRVHRSDECSPGRSHPGSVGPPARFYSGRSWARVASALRVDLPELFRFEHETANRVEIENRIARILKDIPDEDLSRIFLIFQVLFPAQI